MFAPNCPSGPSTSDRLFETPARVGAGAASFLVPLMARPISEAGRRAAGGAKGSAAGDVACDFPLEGAKPAGPRRLGDVVRGTPGTAGEAGGLGGLGQIFLHLSA